MGLLFDPLKKEFRNMKKAHNRDHHIQIFRRINYLPEFMP
jgi:hypothetical protein